jgi:Family of unknown function (DUF695)
MSFLKKLFSKNTITKININKDFWDWFLLQEKTFYKVVKENNNIPKNFFEKIGPKLDELNDGYFYLTGMIEDNIAELIITAEGRIKNIVLVEELVKAAPKIDGWLITALKPAIEKEDAGISIYDYEFDVNNIHFYSTENANTPDEIEITVVHPSCNKENEEDITHGVNIFLDNFLGELNFATKIDSLNVVGVKDAEAELIPMKKLKDYLIWREKEFIEKYDAVRHNIENDNYSILQGELENGNKVFSLFNTDLLQWDAKASHPWITSIELKFDGSKHNGMPDDKTFKLLDKIEEEIGRVLKDTDGYLNVGRETANGVREVFIACYEFRKPSVVLFELANKYAGVIEIEFEIYKDKYWKTFERFEEALVNAEDSDDDDDE